MPNVTAPGASRRWDETRCPAPGRVIRQPGPSEQTQEPDETHLAEIATTQPAPPMLRDAITPRRVAVLAALTVAVLLSLVLLLPALADLPDTGARISHGDGRWLALALGFEVLSFVGHIVLFRAVSLRSGSRIRMRESYQITLAGHAATRLFASAGAGGVALTAWALRRSGMERREVGRAHGHVHRPALQRLHGRAARRRPRALTGLLPGAAPVALTLVPAALGAAVIARRAGHAARGRRPRGAPAPRARRDDRAGAGDGRPAPRAIADGVREALRLARRATPALLGAADVVGLRHRRAVGVLPGVRRRAAGRGARRRATSSGCSPTRCRCPAGSAASTAA